MQSGADTTELEKGDERDAFYAAVVKREVIALAHQAVLIAGADHLRRGVHTNTESAGPNVTTILEREHPGELFVIYPLPFGYDEGIRRRPASELSDSAKPSLAHLDNTCLAGQQVAHRAIDPGSTFGDQVDAVLWFGPEESLTASRADPEIYEVGDDAAEPDSGPGSRFPSEPSRTSTQRLASVRSG